MPPLFSKQDPTYNLTICLGGFQGGTLSQFTYPEASLIVGGKEGFETLLDYTT